MMAYNMSSYNSTIDTLHEMMNPFLNVSDATLNDTVGGAADNLSIPDWWKTIPRVVYIIVFLFGTVGNLLTCYIIISHKFMRRVIHIYTFNLAVSDLAVILLYIPVEFVRNENDLAWTMGASMCKINNIVTPTSLISSVCTLVAITLDRHRGVTSPFKWRGDSKRLLRYSLPAIWLIAIACCAPLFHAAKLEPYEGKLYCIEKWTSNTLERAYWITMFCIMVVIPLCIIIVANTHMIHVMQKLNASVNHCDREQHQQHRRMIRMVVALVLVYALCSSPQHIVFFMFQYGDLEDNKTLSMHLFKAGNIMVIVQSAINPIIYGTGRKDFNNAFRSIFQCLKIREMITSTNDETRFGAWLKSMHTFALPEESVRDDANSPQTLPNRPLVNTKLEKLRRKSIERCITDTPPMSRHLTVSLQPAHQKHHQNGALSRVRNLSLPTGLLKTRNMSSKTPKDDSEDRNQSYCSHSFEIALDMTDLTRIVYAQESNV